MNKFLIFILFLVAGCQATFSVNNKLTKISENGLCGCLNQYGEIIVPIKFNNVNCDGDIFIPVRSDDKFKFYSVENGMVSDSPHYDYISRVEHGFRFATVDGIEYLLSLDGLIDSSHRGQIAILDSNFYSVKRDSGYQIKSKGKDIIEIKTSDFTFKDGHVVTAGKSHFPRYRDSLPSYVYDIGLLNLYGDTIIEFGNYRHIEVIDEKYSMCKSIEPGPLKYGNITYLVSNKNGAIIKEYSEEKWVTVIQGISGPYIEVQDYVEKGLDLSNINDVINKERYTYIETIDGKEFFKNGKFEDLIYFESLELFLGKHDDSLQVLDAAGEVILNNVKGSDIHDYYNGQYIHPHNLHKNHLVVRTDSSLVLVSKTGIKTLTGLPNSKLGHSTVIAKYGSLLVVEEDNIYFEDYNDPSYFRYIYDLDMQRIVSGKYPYIELSDLKNGIVVFGDSDYDYFYSLEIKKIVHTVQFSNKDILALNMDYQLSTDMIYNELQEYKQSDGKREFTITIDTSSSVIKYEHFQGYNCVISNSCEDTLKFDAQDQRLYSKLEVLVNQSWFPIETFKNSWCGNSYHQVNFPPNSKMTFAIPRYSGGVKSKMRLNVFTFRNSKRIDYYSNEVVGFYNPSQLFLEREYDTTPNGNIQHRY